MQNKSKKATDLARKLRRSIATTQAILTFAKAKGISAREASKKFGKVANYINCSMFWLRAAEKKSGVTVPEIARLEQQIADLKTSKQKKNKTKRGKRGPYKKTLAKKINTSAAPLAKTVAKAVSNALSNINDEVEFKYPVITDLPISKIQKTYPLEILQPGHAFAVPANKGEVMAAKKAVTQFTKKHPGTSFVQRLEKNRFITWRKA
jgi:hypothetical protein